jgi:hypothetical protein
LEVRFEENSHILDNESGVDASTIQVKVNGVVVTHTATAIAKGYHITVSGLTYGYGTQVSIELKGSDLAP